MLIGYSKGTPDILEAVVNHPEAMHRVAAVVSFAGVVGGTPIGAFVARGVVTAEAGGVVTAVKYISRTLSAAPALSRNRQ